MLPRFICVSLCRFKAPIRPNSVKYFEEIFTNIEKYFRSLKIDGINLLSHNRKTFALGFILTMKSSLELAKDLFKMDEEPLKYFLTYKCSQDHLELYFSCIRSRGGWNNNPNSQQLKWALRQLLFRNSVTPSVRANCGDFGDYCTPAFEFRSQKRQTQEIQFDSENNEQSINNHIRYLGKKTLTDFQENVIYYISGYIVRSLVNRSRCDHCIEILLYKKENLFTDHDYPASQENYKKFTSIVSRGGLVYAPEIVYAIVRFAEKQFRYLIQNGNLVKNNTNIKRSLINTAVNQNSCK